MSEDEFAMDWGVLSNAVGPRIRLLRNALTARSVSAMAGFDMPTGSMSVMALIAANPGCSQTDLAEHTGLNKSAIAGLVDNLEKRGLAERTTAPGDRRRNVLKLTEKGLELTEEMQKAANAQEDDIRKALTERELKKFIEFLERSIAALEKGQGKPR